MKVLLDEQLPHQLGSILGTDWIHATRVAEQATDSHLWEFARDKDWIILTKDTDFFDKLVLFGSPPKIIWIRLGNLRKKDLLSKLKEVWPEIRTLIEHHDMVQVHDHHLEWLDFPPHA